MSTPSRMLTPTEKAYLDQAARVYVAALEKHLGILYPGGEDEAPFTSWDPIAKLAAIATVAVQSLLSAEAYGEPRLALDPMLKAIGFAIGGQSAHTTQEEFERLMTAFGEGVGIGRAETHAIFMKMPTAGRA